MDRRNVRQAARPLRISTQKNFYSFRLGIGAADSVEENFFDKVLAVESFTTIPTGPAR